MKKLLSLLILFSLVLSVTAMPAQVSAQDGEPTPTEEPAVEPTEEPAGEPTEEPAVEPTEEPAAEPTEEPAEEPTEEPAVEPTAEPTEEPTAEPTEEPAEEPAIEPTEEPTVVPAEEPALIESADEISGSGAQAGPWGATIYISNPNTSAASGAISFYDAADGSLDATYDFTNIGVSGIPAHGSAAIDVASVGIGASSWQGSAVVQASNQVAVQVGLRVNSNTDRMEYSGFTQGSDKVSSPAIACNAFDQDSDLVIMNTGSSATTFTVKYLSTTGGNEPTTGPHTVQGNSSVYLDVCNEVGETGGWLGSATVTGAGGSSLVGVVFQPYVVAPKAVAYETLSGSGGSTVFFPTALQKAFGPQFTSFYALQNVGTGSTTVTLEVFNTSGTSLGTVSQLLAPGGKVSWQPQNAGAPASGFSGSAVASASGGGEIAAITNIGTVATAGCPAGAGQTTAFLNPSNRAEDSGSTLAIPWVEYKSGVDWRSFLAVQNVINTGAGSGTVTVTYYNANGTVATTANLGSISDGAKGNTNPSSAGAGTNFLGSIEITSSNAGDKLVALSNNQQADACHAASALAIPIN